MIDDRDEGLRHEGVKTSLISTSCFVYMRINVLLPFTNFVKHRHPILWQSHDAMLLDHYSDKRRTIATFWLEVYVLRPILDNCVGTIIIWTTTAVLWQKW
jgi:hypothetical protein